MAVQTWYIRQITTGATPANGLWWDRGDTAQTAASSTSTWTVAKIAANNYSILNNGSTQASGTFGATILPDTTAPTLDFTYASGIATYVPPSIFMTTDSISTIYPWNCVVPAGTWTFVFPVVATTVSSQAGAITMRVWKTTNFSSFTELTSALLTGTTATVTTTPANSTVTWSAPVLTFNNEYIVVELAWKIVTASGNNNGNVILRYGVGTSMTTPAFKARTYTTT